MIFTHGVFQTPHIHDKRHLPETACFLACRDCTTRQRVRHITKNAIKSLNGQNRWAISHVLPKKYTDIAELPNAGFVACMHIMSHGVAGIISGYMAF